MGTEEQEPEALIGTVKWFDATKGFGFIVSEETGGDILLHANALRNFGLSSVCDGARIKVSVQKTARGLQAIDVLELDSPVTDATLNHAPSGTVIEIDRSLPIEPARVKWFDKVKGFGFANVFGKSDDVFVHMEALRRCGLAELQAGEAIAVRVIDGERGRMAVTIEPWDAVLGEENAQ